MPFGIQPIHIVIIIVVAFLLFGATKLPELGRSLGKTITEFRKGTKEAAQGFKEEVNKPDTAAPQPAQPGAPSGNFCTQCGTANPPEAHFCSSCGAKLAQKTV